MGKFKPKKFLFSIIFFGILIAGILASISQNSEFGFTLVPPPLAIVKTIGNDGTVIETEVSDWSNPQIACWVWQKLYTTDKDGNPIDEVQSPFLKTNPPAELTLFDKGSGFLLTDKGGFVTLVGIKCSTSSGEPLNPEDTFGEGAIGEFLDEQAPPRVDIPLIIEKSDLIVRMYVQDKDSDHVYHDIFHAPMPTNTLEINDSVKKEYGRLRIAPETIEKYLENGDYYPNFKVAIDGLIKIKFDCDVQACKDFGYVIPISTTRNHLESVEDAYWVTNNWSDIKNPILVNTELHVIKNVDFDTTPPPQECEVNQILQGTTCVDVIDLPPEGEGCPEGTVRYGTAIPVVCVPTTGGGVPVPTPTPTPPSEGFLGQLNSCLNSGEVGCLFSLTFLPLWLGLVGIIFIFGAIIQASRPKPQPEIYGVGY